MIYKIYFCMLLHFVYEVDPAVVDTPKLPSYFKICPQSAPNLGKCIKKSVEELKPLLIKGIPDLDIPSVEPLHIPEVIIDQGSGPVALKSVYKDIKVYGPSKFIIKDIKVDLEKDKMRIRLFIPRLKVICNYNMEGKIMMMPISGSGKSSSNYTNIDASITIRAEKIEKNNNVYYNVKDFDINFDIGEAEIHFDDLFNGDKDLGEAMNMFLNDNWKQIANEIKPVLEDNIAMIFKKFANKIFHKYPKNVLLPK
ncbi:protein takeout-like [Diabrotica undecimpunctata]|uniref:protein takeout-like n=1 Tax=Diabrotica undecimpunctata TaxID=50387 RepID=UPI003B63DA57